MRATSDAQGTSEGVMETVDQLIRKGVVLWVENGGLRYRAPKGLLTSEELDSLYRSRSMIASLLERNLLREIGRPRGAPLCQAPLSFTQLAHWHERMQAGGRPLRTVASATRIQGELAVEPLREAIYELVLRHDALRTHIEVRNGVPMQRVAAAHEHVLGVVSLEAIQLSSRDAAIQDHIQRVLIDADDYAIDPLFRAVLLKLGAEEHVLVLAMDHIISDGYSVSLLSSELWTAYAQRVNGKSIKLPSVGIQFNEYALRLRARSSQLLKSLDSYRRHFNRTRFPTDLSQQVEEDISGWGVSTFLIRGELLSELREWVRVNQTTLVMAIFTAYAATVLRWCGVREAVIQFMIDGRICADVDVEHTVGYFAFPLFIKVTLRETDGFLDFLRAITAEYCAASDEADFGFSHSQLPRPDFTRNTSFNWLPGPRHAERERLEEMECPIRCSSIDFSSPVQEAAGSDLDYEPGIVLAERENGIGCEIHFPRHRFSVAAMERFTEEIIRSIVVMVKAREVRVSELALL